ncbi:unnamed protein product, partial [Ectocarpus sp. 4 AP-2014]
WEKRLRAWIEHDAIQEVAQTEKGDAARRTLSCICNTIDEHLYKVFVAERKAANKIALAYPRKMHLLTKKRSKVLYYIAGYLLSRAWKHMDRAGIEDMEWGWFIRRH